MLLVIDIGNSRVGMALFRAQRITKRFDRQTIACDSASKVAWFIREGIDTSDRKELEGICISSVVPNRDVLFKMACINAFGIEPLFVTPANAGISLSGYDPKQIGVDRLVNSLAAFEMYQKSAIVIDAGSCITFDAVSDDGGYLGGAIVPGISLAVRSLHEMTAKLPNVEIKPTNHAIGRNTKESICSGICFGYAGLIQGMVGAMSKEMKGKPFILATGGDARMISKMSPIIEKIHPDLTFEGLRLIWEKNR